MSLSRSASPLAVAALLWAVALPLAAWLRGRPGGEDSVWAFVVYGLGAVICHQRPERSFFLGAVPLPICARCAGIYVGAAAVGLLTLVGGRISDRSPRQARQWLMAAATPAALSLVYEWTTARTPSNVVRAATGLLVGAAATAIVLGLIDGDARRRSRANRQA